MALPFTSLDDLINSMTGGYADDVPWAKFSTAPVAVGVWHSTWAEAGSPGRGGTDSGGTQYYNGSGGSGSKANAGGFGFGTVAVSPQGRICTALSVESTQVVNLLIADRLCAIGPVTVSSTGSKTLTTMPTLPRYTSGVGVEVWLEVTTAFTTTAGSFYLNSYTGNSNGSGTNATSSNVATAIASTIKVGDMIGPFPLLTPDTGVTALASFYVNTAPAAGAVNVVLLRRLQTAVPIALAGTGNSRNMITQLPAMPIIYDGATLFAMYQAGSTVAPNLYGSLTTAYK